MEVLHTEAFCASKAPAKSEADIERILELHGNRLYRTAYLLLGNPHDVQDILQETMIRYMEKAPSFQNGEHEKAWLLKVTVNLCRDLLRFHKKHSCISLEELPSLSFQPEEKQLLASVLELPDKYKAVLLLHYAEGYPVREIASLLHLSENAVKKRLQRGREQLKESCRLS